MRRIIHVADLSWAETRVWEVQAVPSGSGSVGDQGRPSFGGKADRHVVPLYIQGVLRPVRHAR